MIDFILLLLFGFITGIRHGFDIDHITAITDITASQKKRNRGIFYATLYALGHGVMVIGLGLLLTVVGQSVPESVDVFFGKIVGVTLIVLGFYVLYSLYRYGRDFKMKSRWMLVFDAIKFGYHRLLHNFDLTHEHREKNQRSYEPKNTFVIGMIHGVGAETPTQIAALATLVGISDNLRRTFFLSFFVVGILAANVAVAFFFSYGYLGVKQNRTFYMGIGIITAIFSIVVGIIFLLE